MPGLSSLIALCGVLLLVTGRADAMVNDCQDIGNCFQYFEGPCTSDGKRQVCIRYSNTDNACTQLGSSLDFCLPGDMMARVTSGVLFCSSEPEMGSFTFGIVSSFSPLPTGSGPVTIDNYPNGQADCQGFLNVCSERGGNDFRLTFNISPCLATTAGLVDNCKRIESCFQYFESPTCTSDGKRLVCIKYSNTDNTCTSLGSSLDFCRQNNFVTTPTPSGERFCSAEPVMGSFTFGIASTFGTDNTDSGPVTITNYHNGQANCQGFTNVCAASGNNDFSLEFNVSPCPTTTAAPDVTTTVSPPCMCTAFTFVGLCSTTCGFGVQEQRRTCMNCSQSLQTSTFVQCPNNPPCTTTAILPATAALSIPATATAVRVDGMWGPWGTFTTCTATCEGGTQKRTRTCNNPPPSNGGQGCVEPMMETIICNTRSCPRASRPKFKPRLRTRPRVTPKPGPRPGSGLCATLRGRALRRCIRARLGTKL